MKELHFPNLQVKKKLKAYMDNIVHEAYMDGSVRTLYKDNGIIYKIEKG